MTKIEQNGRLRALPHWLKKLMEETNVTHVMADCEAVPNSGRIEGCVSDSMSYFKNLGLGLVEFFSLFQNC